MRNAPIHCVNALALGLFAAALVALLLARLHRAEPGRTPASLAEPLVNAGCLGCGK